MYRGIKSGEDTVRPHGIRGLFFCHTDPLIADSDTNLWERALRHLDFACSVDLYITSTAEACPAGIIVLPECTYLERTVVGRPSVASLPTVTAQVKAVEPHHQSKSLHNIMVSLATAMSDNHGETAITGWFGRGAHAANYTATDVVGGSAAWSGRLHRLTATNDEGFAARSATHTNFTAYLPGNYDMTWDRVKADGGAWPLAADQTLANYPRRLASAIRADVITEDHSGGFAIAGVPPGTLGGVGIPGIGPNAGRYAFAHAGTQLHVNLVAYRENRGLAPGTNVVPVWRNPDVMPTAAHPLRFFPGGRVMWHTMAATANLPYLMQNFDRMAETDQNGNILFINPADAATRKILTGDWVFVASPAGRVRVRAVVDHRACPGAVNMAHGFGVNSPAQKTAHNRGVNANRLCSASMFNAAGQFANNDTIVQVVRA